MKIAVIGSCLAGMSVTLRLLNSGHEVSLWSPHCDLDLEGPGYLINSVTVDSLSSLGLHIESNLIHLLGGDAVDYFDPCNSGDSGLLFAVDSAVLHREFLRCIGQGRLHFEARFSHFEPNHEYHVNAAKFYDQRSVSADLFIGADGAQSCIRKNQISGSATTAALSTQISGSSRVGDDSSLLQKKPKSYVDADTGTQILVYPSGENTCSWKLQLDVCQLFSEFSDVQSRDCSYLARISKNWPTDLRSLFQPDSLQSIRFKNCSDRRLPHLFHKENVVLIGEAAHPTLPCLTTAPDSDLEDALCLGELMDDLERGFLPSMETCLTEFMRLRRPVLNSRIRRGRKNHAEFVAHRPAFSR